MFDKYLFTPASNKKFLKNVSRVGADYIVFDLEDAIKRNEIDLAIENLKNISYRDNYLIRIPFTNINEHQLTFLIKIGYKKFIIPKIRNSIQLKKILREYPILSQAKFIILVENPELLLSIYTFMQTHKRHIIGLALGSHDYANEVNMQHAFENLYFARSIILNVAKASGVSAIDIASMEISNETKLHEEFVSAVRMGFDGKFFIHPNQLRVFDKTIIFTDDEIEEARAVVSILKGNTDYAAFRLRGKVFEKPHLSRLKRIIKWAESHEKL